MLRGELDRREPQLADELNRRAADWWSPTVRPRPRSTTRVGRREQPRRASGEDDGARGLPRRTRRASQSAGWTTSTPRRARRRPALGLFAVWLHALDGRAAGRAALGGRGQATRRASSHGESRSRRCQSARARTAVPRRRAGDAEDAQIALDGHPAPQSLAADRAVRRRRGLPARGRRRSGGCPSGGCRRVRPRRPRYGCRGSSRSHSAR